ncbi:hypothetical protein [Streptomyces lomondensis]|uniref:hypothetical protein n=1 Tax=Streptomyces lomondensis TaxID=68229 RepID=UPI0016780652|nr:hypothetical protein [Streptomyces lomondensis]MCF0076506.1 hypothetical protein [Streptomyces lomondensis]
MAPDLAADERMRLECVRLSAQGRIAPEIAKIVNRHVATGVPGCAGSSTADSMRWRMRPVRTGLRAALS